MTTLEAAQRYVTLKPAGIGRHSGMCPQCGGDSNSNKFVVYTNKDDFHCFGCGLHGDAITLLRTMENMSCPDAHEAVGRSCNNTSCPAWDACRLGARANGQQPKKKQAESLSLPPEPADQAYVPDQAATPAQNWQAQAAIIIDKAHTNLLESADQLAYLEKRGLPLDAVKQYRLGWLPENRYPARESWGLPTEIKPDGKKKKMFLPEGVIIPFFDANGQPHRIRIRRSNPRPADPRYYWVPGSGNDVPVLGDPQSRAVVVIESDLDSLMVLWQCRDLDVCTLTLGTVGAKPKDWAYDICQNALSILVALDFEPRHNSRTGQPENPGGKAASWWLETFSRAKRHPVPSEKDPGEYYEAGGDVRAWVLSGLPPIFHIAAPHPQKPAAPEKAPAPVLPEHSKGKTLNGYDYVVAHRNQDVKRLQLAYPGVAIFSPDEIREMKGMTADDAEKILIAKQVFDGTITETRQLDNTTEPAPLPPEPDDYQGEMNL